TMPSLCGVRHAGSLRAVRPLFFPLFAVRRFSALAFSARVASACAPGHRDALFGRQRRQALRKRWDCGLKAVPRANPG
ncbi:MAG: hypothetical protein K2I62_02955, partial [Alistipes sp.]|nr:hypothetical protein [Alistipes sp.]